VYILSRFLAVMALFGIDLLLKFKRKKLPRPEKSLEGLLSWALIITAFIGYELY
jgi:hypothetical protein